MYGEIATATRPGRQDEDVAFSQAVFEGANENNPDYDATTQALIEALLAQKAALLRELAEKREQVDGMSMHVAGLTAECDAFLSLHGSEVRLAAE